MLLSCSWHRLLRVLTTATAYRLLKSPHFTENVGLFTFLLRSSTFSLQAGDVYCALEFSGTIALRTETAPTLRVTGSAKSARPV